MRFAVFGAGAVGAYFGGRLAQAGEDVVFIARGTQLRALRRDGLRVESLQGSFHLHPVHATDDPDAAGKVDCIVVGVKAWQLTEAARAMKPLMGPETLVLPLQNGVEAVPALARELGSGPVIGGLCRIMSRVVEPGVVRHEGADPLLVFGRPDGGTDKRLEALRSVWERCKGMAVSLSPDIGTALWGKFLLIAPWSGVGAVTRVPIGVFRSVPETRRLLVSSMKEVYRVGRACGAALPEDGVEKTVALVDSLPEEGFASMQRDVMEGRPSELEQQNGAVVRLGREAGIPVPVNAFLYHSLLPQELQARGGRIPAP
jgi:2-dehydropantoate 2-reductase